MAVSESRRRRFGWPGLAQLPTVIALAVILAAAVFAERQHQDLRLQQLRAEVMAQLSVVRAQLEGKINANLQLSRGLVAVIATEPEIDQQRFAELASQIVTDRTQIRSLAGAPDLVISLMYPVEGNEAALGFDYRDMPGQSEAALRARDSGELVLAGPLDLVQGGRGFVSRFPVMLASEPGNGGAQEGGAFWGLLAVVIGEEDLYRASGLRDPRLGIDIAITGRDALGAAGETFFGDPAIRADAPVEADVFLPNGSWRLSARPEGGWDGPAPDTWLLRGFMLLGGALIVVPLFVTGRLVNARQRALRDLEASGRELERLSHRHDLALEASRVGVWERDIESGALHWDERMHDLYGVRPGAIASNAAWVELLYPQDRTVAQQDYERAVGGDGIYSSQFRIERPDGDIRHIRAKGAIDYDQDGRRRLVGINWDVTEDVYLADALRLAKEVSDARSEELAAAKARIEHGARYDPLTGLANRRFLEERLVDAAKRATASGDAAAKTPETMQGTAGETRLVLLHMDLDGFQQINDTLGHGAGDAVLKEVASRLRHAVEAGDFVAYLGADEFAVFLRRSVRGQRELQTELAALARSLISRLSEPVRHGVHSCRFGLSLGIAETLEADFEPARLLVNADIALSRAKRRGRNTFQFFTAALASEVVTTKRLADELLNAIERDEFVVHYQPQVDARDRRLVGVEALVRWQHPRDGLLAPGAFLAVAQELDVLARIDELVLEKALAELARWDAAGLRIPRVSVNVSVQRLHDPNLQDSLKPLALPPGRIGFELLESIYLDEASAVLDANLQRLADLGIAIEIDDFGTGHASIAGLLQLNPSRLKIARQFVQALATTPVQRRIVGSIIEMGRSLGIEILAEGVETERQAGILRALGCQVLQGYAFGKPMPAEDLARFVTERGSQLLPHPQSAHPQSAR